MLVSHFLLDLQEAHQRVIVKLETNDPLHTSQGLNDHSVGFRKHGMLGSLGATIIPSEYRDPQEEGDENVDDLVVSSEGTPPNDGDCSLEMPIERGSATAEVTMSCEGGGETTVGA